METWSRRRMWLTAQCVPVSPAAAAASFTHPHQSPSSLALSVCLANDAPTICGCRQRLGQSCSQYSVIQVPVPVQVPSTTTLVSGTGRYRPIRVVPDKRPLNGCVCVTSSMVATGASRCESDLIIGVHWTIVCVCVCVSSTSRRASRSRLSRPICRCAKLAARKRAADWRRVNLREIVSARPSDLQARYSELRQVTHRHLDEQVAAVLAARGRIAADTRRIRLTLSLRIAGTPSNTHAHIRLTALCPGLPGWAGTRKVKAIWILLKQATVSGSGISWAICKSAPRSRQITTPAPTTQFFYKPDALPAAQPTASKHWRQSEVAAVLTAKGRTAAATHRIRLRFSLRIVGTLWK